MKRFAPIPSLATGIALLLAGCASYTPPDIAYDNDVPSLPAPPPPLADERPGPVHTAQSERAYDTIAT